jgi:NTE family protein
MNMKSQSTNDRRTKSFSSIVCSLFLCILPWTSTKIHAQPHKDVKNPKVAVVLSGGGAKGFAHIGALKILEEEGIPIDIIVGNSMGSLIGGFYSLGYTADEIEKIVKKQNWEMLLSDNVPRSMLSENNQMLKQRYQLSFSFSDVKSIGLPQGVIKGQNIMNIFCNLAANVPVDADFSRFPIPFACVAADLETGSEVVITDGFFPKALFSSMAIPGIFQPVRREDRLLVDGGVVNNFPTDVAKRMGADIIIGVDIRGPLKTKEELTSVDEIFNQMIGFLGQGKDSVNNSLCDIIIRPEITGYSVGSFSHEAADSLILRGKRAALLQREKIRELKRKHNLKQREYSREYVADEKWQITNINFTGDYKLDKAFLKNKLNLEIPGRYSGKQIKNAIDRLYGYGDFDLVYYYLTGNDKNKTLCLDITPRKVYSQQLGFKANTNDAAALLFNITRKNYEKPVGYLSLSTELSANPGASIVAETSKRNLPTLGVELKGKYQKYNIFERGNKLYNSEMFYASIEIYLYKSFFNKLKLGAGIREEYYNGDVFSKNPGSSSVSASETDRLLTSTYAYFTFDNMDHFYFPTRGTRLKTNFSVNTDFSDYPLSPTLLFEMNKVIPVRQNVAFLFDLYSRSLFSSNNPLIKTTLVGGEPYSRYFNYHLPFVGLPPLTLTDRYTNIGLAGIRVQVAKNRYFSFVYNLLVQGNDFDHPGDFNTMGGGGIKYSVNTAIGPLDLGMGYSEYHRTPTLSANFGYWF